MRPLDKILDAIRSREPRQATDDIMTLRRLLRGNYLAIVATETSRKALENNGDWLQAIAPSAKVKRHTYTVWAHGVRIKAIDISKQEEAIAIIREAN